MWNGNDSSPEHTLHLQVKWRSLLGPGTAVAAADPRQRGRANPRSACGTPRALGWWRVVKERTQRGPKTAAAAACWGMRTKAPESGEPYLRVLVARQPAIFPLPILRPDATPEGRTAALETRRPRASTCTVALETPALGLQVLAAMLVTYGTYYPSQRYI